jgi:hypothetical protein
MSLQNSEAAAALGSIKTPRKTASSQETIKIAQAARRTPKPCTCGQDPHRQPCPVYYREQQAKRRAK